jgi:transposase
VVEGSSTAVTMLGLPGLVVLAVDQIDGEIETTVETTATRAWCRSCGVRAVGHGRREIVVRDIDVFDRHARLRWRKRVWRCPEAACPVRTWTETHAAVRPRAALTVRAEQSACRRVGRDNTPVAVVARDYGVGWHTVMRAVDRQGRPLIDDPARLADVVALGVDETAFLRASAVRSTQFVSGLVDSATGRLLDVVEDRTAQAVMRWLADRDRAWLAAVNVVTLDPHRGFANAVGYHLGHATLVVDHWHAVRLANACVDDVRRRVQQDTLGHRGRKGDPLYGVRRVLLKAAERLTDRQWRRLEAAWVAGDARDEVYNAWAVKELLRDVYAAGCLYDARVALGEFYDWAHTCGVPETARLARTIKRWEAEILAWHTTGGASNGPTEAVNLLIKKVQRTGHGFRNFSNYRLRLLLHCGIEWQDQPAARLRRRQPRSAA